MRGSLKRLTESQEAHTDLQARPFPIMPRTFQTLRGKAWGRQSPDWEACPRGHSNGGLRQGPGGRVRMGMNKSMLGRVALRFLEKSCTWPLVRLGPTRREDGNVSHTPLLKHSQWLPTALRKNK